MGPGTTGAHGGSGLSAIGGTLRLGELGPGGGHVREGSLLALPATVDITALGLETAPALGLAWTLQNYGGYRLEFIQTLASSSSPPTRLDPGSLGRGLPGA